MRNSHLMIYGSSYDRGVEHLLNMWPDIKKEVPDAELRIFYGWNLFDLGYADNPERMAWKAKINKLMEQPGITHLGRISHEACIKEHENAGVWAYPTHFGEISCITAMRAQIYGSVPCVINYAALRETVKWGVKIKGDIYDKETKELYKNSLIALLKDEKYQEDVRKEMMPEAQKLFAWSNVAKQWDEEFKRVITPEEKAMKLILKDEPLEALDLLDGNSPLKQKLLKKLDHIFNSESYYKKYALDLMNWKPQLVDYSRHDWILKEAKDAKTLIDLGCYEGSLLSKFKGKSKGIEICKEAVRFAKSKGLDVIEGDACTYRDNNKYDAVCACELIEHVPNPQSLIGKMVEMTTPNGWCYLTTPNGCFDPVSTKKVWEDKDALIDHVRTYNDVKMKNLLDKYEGGIYIKGKEIYAKFRKSLAKEVEALMEDNQALKAWDLVKDTNSPLKDRVWLRVKHAFDKDAYKKYYSEELEENPVSEDMARDCTKLAPRFSWVVNEILRNKYKKILDLGCADGYLCLTLALKGLKCTGVNLYGPSINIARERASKFGVDCEFIQKDLFEIEGKYDAVVLFEVLEHLPNPKNAIRKCMDLVKKNGSLYLSTPRIDHVGIEAHKKEVGHKGWDDGKPTGHLRVYTEKELVKLLQGYQIEQILIDNERSILLEVKRNDENVH